MDPIIANFRHWLHANVCWWRSTHFQPPKGQESHYPDRALFIQHIQNFLGMLSQPWRRRLDVEARLAEAWRRRRL